MDWTLAIIRNRDALKPIIAALYALAGRKSGTASVMRENELPLPLRLPRHLISAILLVLRPAESAVRRLIVILSTLMEAARQASALPLIQSFGPPSPHEWRGEGSTRDKFQNTRDVHDTIDDGENINKSIGYPLLPATCGEKVAKGRMRGSANSGRISSTQVTALATPRPQPSPCSTC